VQRYPAVFEAVRGQGLMLGLKMKVPNVDFVNALYGEGLLAVAAGDNVIRLLPPLIIAEKELREGIDKLSAAAEKFSVKEVRP
jgi:acetylornithine/N-succinyldiaminopimelate aminotransferase